VSGMEYRIEYDSVADALYIRVKDEEVFDSLEINENVIIDLNEKHEIIGMEILNFSKTKISLNEIITKGIETTVKIA
jgi:uncharacterized protein YuzE